MSGVSVQTEPLVSALLSDVPAGQTCLVDPGRESHHVVLTHLMTWHLALSFTGHLDTQRKVMTAESLRSVRRRRRVLCFFHSCAFAPEEMPTDQFTYG